MSTQNTLKNYTKYAKEYEKLGPQSFFHKFIEKPDMYGMLPDLSGKKVLCIGVGTGEEADYLRGLGADVVGIDVSEGGLDRAKQKYPGIRFELMDMDKLDFPDESFDFVYSSLALHHSENIKDLFKKIYSVLKVGGVLQFSTTHPVRDAVESFTEGDTSYQVLGSKKISGKSYAVGDYFSNRMMQIEWSDDFVVDYYHFTISEWLNSVLNAGFIITKVSEPVAIEEAKDFDEERYLLYNKKPLFFVVQGKKDLM
jgi:ubiquinone/menaquinone biosynthesis C-methylase UbiE